MIGRIGNLSFRPVHDVPKATPPPTRGATAPSSGYDGAGEAMAREMLWSPRPQGGRDTSTVGFGLLSRWEHMGQRTQRALAAAAMGFALLLPPVTGQIINPGLTQREVPSPIAVQLVQQSKLKSGPDIRNDVSVALAGAAQKTGAARESALTKVIAAVNAADEQVRRSDAVAGEAGQKMQALRAQIPWDAQHLGFVGDLYWFGVPSANMSFHQGADDASRLTMQQQDVRAAATEAKASARAAIAELLKDESPSFRKTSERFAHVDGQYQETLRVEKLAERAHAELDGAGRAIMLRNLTPKTVTVQDYRTETKVVDGKTVTEQVPAGSHEEPNPAYAAMNAAAVAQKAQAESAVRELSAALPRLRALVPEAQLRDVDANLIGFLDFVGQPSFGLWSFDSGDVDAAKAKVSELEGGLHQLAASIAPERNSLDAKIQRAIDLRWDSLRPSTRVS